MTKEEKAKALLEKYAAGEATAAERQHVETWYASQEYREFPIGADKKAAIGAAIFQELQREMQQTQAARLVRLKQWYKVAKAAAVLLLVAAAAVLLWPEGGKQTAGPALAAVRTSASQKKNIVLADGSKINLGPSSCLTYPVKFSGRKRVVELNEGDAFFDIAHDASRPFTVKTVHDLETRVLGTSFRIQARAASPVVKITVATGKVAVGNTKQVFGTLVKGQQITYDKKQERALIDYTPAPVYVNLVFEKESLQQICSKLEYAYGIKINLKDQALGRLKCTATFNTRQAPEEIMDLLCSLHRMKFNQSDDHKTFNVYKK
ncbi:transmembrane sensor [Pedobacter africanus]|uniref:Ferric-dicitrate binding protein FerR (Iron transport regulator) n=1 Tax=Pedobacter africanus TaxID=151894 RepID=A0ACC6KQU9_9SPHI|nr:FecR domain-containing protein [Pedobacter africanus]MDR6781602.1 ferric-dicitrate binding protein FerR (iron transport regulator) [Pedobacter africanus]